MIISPGEPGSTSSTSGGPPPPAPEQELVQWSDVLPQFPVTELSVSKH